MRDKILAKCWDVMLVSSMVLGASIAITLAITIPFMAFGWLHAGFCGK